MHQANLFDTDLILQLDPTDPLLGLSARIPWQEFEDEFAVHYKIHTGAPSKPIRLRISVNIERKLPADYEIQHDVLTTLGGEKYRALQSIRNYLKVALNKMCSIGPCTEFMDSG